MGALTPRSLHALFAITENLRFFTRLPLGSAAGAPDFSKIGWATPLAGAIIGGFGAAVLLGGHKLGLPATASATLAAAAEMLVTGGIHEDGLADVADGFGGGRDRNAKLTIMRDSRIGAYGAISLFVMLLLRVEAIGALARVSASFAVAGLVLSAAAARGAALTPLVWAPPARSDGLGSNFGALNFSVLFKITATLFLLAVALGLCVLEIFRAVLACVIGMLTARAFVAFACREIGGQTGDVCGATAAIVEVVVLLALLIGGQDA